MSPTLRSTKSDGVDAPAGLVGAEAMPQLDEAAHLAVEIGIDVPGGGVAQGYTDRPRLRGRAQLRRRHQRGELAVTGQPGWPRLGIASSLTAGKPRAPDGSPALSFDVIDMILSAPDLPIGDLQIKPLTQPIGQSPRRVR